MGGSEKVQICLDLGAERVINYREEDFVQVIKEITNNKGVDVILDMVGGDYVQRNLSALAVEGRLVFIAFLRGAKMELNLAPVMMKRLTITGSTLRARPVAHKAPIAQALRKKRSGHYLPAVRSAPSSTGYSHWPRRLLHIP